MKIQDLLRIPLLNGARVLAGEEAVGQSFNWCCRGGMLSRKEVRGNAPGILLIYEGREENESWREYLERVKELEVSGILLVCRKLTQYDIAEEDYPLFTKYEIPLIWCMYENITMFMTRIKAFIQEEFRHEQMVENWLYDLCYKNSFGCDEGIAVKNGYNSKYEYYCAIVKLHSVEQMQSKERERIVIKAANIVESQAGSAEARVLDFLEKDAVVCFIPIRPKLTFKELKKMMYQMEQEVNEKTKVQWVTTVGSQAKTAAEFGDSFQNAVKTAHVVSCFDSTPGIDFYEEWQVALLPLYAPYSEIERFAEKWIGPIREEEDLVDTLKIYVLTKMNLRETALALHVHQSTLKYRLKKISKILDCDLNDYLITTNLQNAIVCDGYLNGIKGNVKQYVEQKHKRKNEEELGKEGQMI